jgi:hypothetical protein
MASLYPGGLDSLQTTHVDNVGELIKAADVNDLADAVNKVEAELGVDPSGSAATVAARLASVVGASSVGVNVKDYGALLDGVTDDSAAVAAARSALPGPADAKRGTLVFPPGDCFLGTTAFILGTREHWVGSGGSIFGAVTVRGVTTLITARDGAFLTVPLNAAAWRLQGFTIVGDRTLASQDLLVLNGPMTGTVRDVGVAQAGRDGIVMNRALNVHFDEVYVRFCARDGWVATDENNACLFSKCLARENDRWGIRWEGGVDAALNNFTIESNNRAAAGGGGFLLDDQSGKSIVLGDGPSPGKPGLLVGGDTQLYREAADQWRSKDRITAERVNVSDLALEVRREGETFPRFYVRADGQMAVGQGVAAADLGLPPVRLVAGPVSDASFSSVPPNGTVALDTTNSRVYARIGGVWKSAALA